MSLLFALLAVTASPQQRPVDTVPQYPSGIIEERYEEPPNRQNCAVPLPRADERLILLGFYDGASLPDHSVVGTAQVTTSGVIKIGMGPGKVFLVLASSQPMIFRLSGRVERLNRVVVVNRVGGGVTGISSRKVSFGIGRNCDVGTNVGSKYTQESMQETFGRRPDAAAYTYKLFEWTVAGRSAGASVEAPSPGYFAGTNLEQSVGRFWPGGVVRIDPFQLVSSQTAEKYDILPSTAGALQLERAGFIVRATEADLEAWRAKARVRYGNEVVKSMSVGDVYRVVRPITIPAGLCGGHTISFLIPEGTFISGTPCHSDIIGTNGRIYHWAGHYDPEELEDRPNR